MNCEIDKQIEILQAFKEGKKIEVLCDDGEWGYISADTNDYYPFNFDTETYRIKPGPKLRPYKNMREYVQAAKEHGLYIIRRNATCSASISIEAHDSCVKFPAGDLVDYEHLLKNFVWQDGSPCGVEED